jgi:hypothetical protein
MPRGGQHILGFVEQHQRAFGTRGDARRRGVGAQPLLTLDRFARFILRWRLHQPRAKRLRERLRELGFASTRRAIKEQVHPFGTGRKRPVQERDQGCGILRQMGKVGERTARLPHHRPNERRHQVVGGELAREQEVRQPPHHVEARFQVVPRTVRRIDPNQPGAVQRPVGPQRFDDERAANVRDRRDRQRHMVEPTRLVRRRHRRVETAKRRQRHRETQHAHFGAVEPEHFAQTCRIAQQRQFRVDRGFELLQAFEQPLLDPCGAELAHRGAVDHRIAVFVLPRRDQFAHVAHVVAVEQDRLGKDALLVQVAVPPERERQADQPRPEERRMGIPVRCVEGLKKMSEALGQNHDSFCLPGGSGIIAQTQPG